MLTYTFEKKGNMPYYQYLYELLKQDILSGKLKDGERLPSKRSFAKQLGLSVMTIENAYEQLLVEGYIDAVEKKGYYVAAIQEQGLGGYFPVEQEPPVFRDLGEEQEWLMDFTTNHIPQQNFPMAIWAKLMRRVLSRQPKDILISPPSQGIYELRAAIASHLAHFRGMEIAPEQVVIGAGTEYLYQILIQLLGRDRIYGMEDPGYQKLALIYEANGVTFHPLPLDRKGISLSALEHSEVSVLHISPAHHFPTGIVMPISRRQQLLQWAQEREERYILEDDYDCEFRFGGLPIPTLQSIDGKDKVIYMNTFSKSMTPSIRISYMVLPQPLLRRFREQLGFYSCTVSNFEQYTLASFIQEGYFEKHINRMRNFYRSRRNQVIAGLKESGLWEQCRIQEENAGLHFLVRLETSLPDKVFLERLKKQGIRIRCLADYSRKKQKEYAHTFIINYTALDMEKLPEALKRMKQCL